MVFKAYTEFAVTACLYIAAGRTMTSIVMYSSDPQGVEKKRKENKRKEQKRKEKKRKEQKRKEKKRLD